VLVYVVVPLVLVVVKVLDSVEVKVVVPLLDVNRKLVVGEVVVKKVVPEVLVAVEVPLVVDVTAVECRVVLKVVVPLVVVVVRVVEFVVS
jgi:hypothetical protein